MINIPVFGVNNTMYLIIWSRQTSSPFLGSFNDLWSIPILCDIGYGFNVTAGKCYNCTKGSYKTTKMNEPCTLCRAGSVNPFEGSTTALDCQPCPVGHYQSLTGQASCKQCPTGQYQDKIGKTECKPCGAGE